MDVQEILEELGLTLDDIRWFLSVRLSEKLMEMKDDPAAIAQYIWSGEMESHTYNMEENYFAELEDRYKRNLSDEAQIREILREVELERKKRDGLVF